MAKGLTYKAAGVDMDAGEQIVENIKAAVERTQYPWVLKQISNHFAGVISLAPGDPLLKNYKRPLLVAGTDGVGTKLRIALEARRCTTVGQDLVAMCVNDVVVLGAEPFFFLDYLAAGKLDVELHTEVVTGVAEACRKCDCPLLGGELAEMPGFYAPGDFDLAGFAVGVVEEGRLIEGRRITEGDTVLGLASSGLHSNGYSLARKIVFETAGLKVGDELPGLGRTVADELLIPTRLYSPAVLKVLRYYGTKRVVHGMAHITGGGLEGNVPRILPQDLRARIKRDAWPVPEVFTWLQKAGGVSAKEMWRVFNMGIGLVMVVSPYYAGHIAGTLEKAGETVYRIGRIARGNGDAVLV